MTVPLRHGAHSISTTAAPTVNREPRGDVPRQRAPPSSLANAERSPRRQQPQLTFRKTARRRSSSRASAMSARRCLGSFSRHRFNSLRMAGGVVGPAARSSPARLFSTDASVSDYIVALERALPGQHLVEHAAERPDVAALVRRLAPSPAPASCTPPCPRITPMPVAAGDVIVGDCDRRRRAGLQDRPLPDRRASPARSPAPSPCRRADLDVGRLQITMDDPLLVRRFERLGRSAARSAAPRRWQPGTRPSRDALVRQRRALDQLQHQRAHGRLP